jgi:flagellar biosynthesis protein FlhB
MKISDYIDTFHEFTGLTSSVARQLMFSGIALIWIFKLGKDGNYTLSSELMIPVAILILALFLDLMQYVVGSIIWFFFYRYLEKNDNYTDTQENIKSSECFTYILNVFFIAKVLAVIIAYYFLFSYAYQSIKFT